MLRAFFLAMGIYLLILGGECLVLEKAVMAGDGVAQRPQQVGIFGETGAVTKQREIKPSEWAPWSFLSAGAVVILYGLAMNKS